jgi:exodeoxyribonuclease V gamma subunit
MAIELLVSNSLQKLADDLCVQIHKQEKSVFLKINIVTQTEGMNIWLKQQLAQQLGIVANFAFPSPNNLIFEVYRLLGGTYKDSLSKENLEWLLYQILGEEKFTKRYPIQAQYFQVSTPDRDLKRMGLA